LQDNELSKLKYIILQFFRNAQRLFHMLVGLAFLVLAAAGVTVSFSEWQHYLQSPSEGVVRLILYASFTVVLIIFGLYSFAKARSIR
jgi:sulfite exporter TauE/SafE